MKKITPFMLLAILASALFTGCASNNYDTGYNSYSYETPQDREVNRVIANEMNSLSDADIAQLNTLK